MHNVDLSRYENSGYEPGGGYCKRALWYIVNALIFDSWFCPLSCFKPKILRVFGAAVGRGVVIKPRVNIKYPWRLQIGDHVWIGEGCWIDNLANITIGNHTCISQGAYLLTGNHDYKDVHFGLITEEIKLADGCWIGARAIICPGVNVGEAAVVTAGSILQDNAQARWIHHGHPARAIRQRVIRAEPLRKCHAL